jgi:Protein N-terminal asparagine amidohydrolase
MVIANSDSTGTLVSLDEHDSKQMYASLSSSPTDVMLEARSMREHGLRSSLINIPNDTTGQSTLKLPLYSNVDSYLQGCHPQIVDRAMSVLSHVPVEYTEQTKDRLIYVGQGEIAHATALQADVLVSDRATTCHVLAWQSTSEANVPLATLTHLDGATYEDCLRSAFDQHVEHHKGEEMQVDVHIVGGYCDANGTSASITNWLLPLLADLSEEYDDVVTMNLVTCAVSALNDDGCESPIGRGMAIDLRSGRVFLAHCSPSAMGPMATLRSVRLWSSCEHRRLSCVHCHQANAMFIQPFSYRPFDSLDTLLSLPDSVLLQYTSTSPECEDDDFVPMLRQTLQFLRSVPCHKAFPRSECLVFRRAGRCNAWKQA